MPRTARIKGLDCIYHIIIRGNNREKIFRTDDDKRRFLYTIEKFKLKYDFLLYAYVLMDNHVHLIVNSNGEDISKIMQSINISYTYYFNRKYNRIGHLFQDRFKSILVNDDSYIISLSKYIHNNPVRASMVNAADDYIWSSCRAYVMDGISEFEILDTDLILKYFSEDFRQSKALYNCFLLDKSGELKHEDVYVVQKKLNTVIKNSDRECMLNMEEVIKLFSDIYKIPVDDILLKNNKHHSSIRSECLYIVRLKCKESIKNIGSLFGGICPSAVSYSISKIIKKMVLDKAVYDRIIDVLNLIA